MQSKYLKRKWVDQDRLIRRCLRSESGNEVVHSTSRRRKVFANSSDLHLARVWIYIIARPE